ncbi:ATP-binding protein [Massilioclostridium coli]|uniref:DNA polymerase III subunit n=1 Tax=Massilioclostridium coli TaxID=1870991 RepID=UPI00085BEAB7|nr:DNA polymerase III subunit [Massilioclostridium coli]
MSFHFYGNTKALQVLQQSIQTGHLSHAYLFYGPAGVGKQTLAKQFAQAIFCQGENIPCGHCIPCQKMLKNIHPDFQELGGQNTKNSFHVKEVRAIRSDAYIRPNDGEAKVYLLNGVDNMSKEAANSLLKVLEEPPDNVVFLLTCPSRSAVLPTLVSRCVPIEIFPVTQPECIQALQELSPDTTLEEITRASQLCDGIIGKGLELLSDPEEIKASQTAFQILESLSKGNELAVVVALSPLENSRPFTKKVLLFLSNLLRLALQAKIKKISILGLDDFIQKQSIQSILKMADTVETCIGMLEQNANLKLCVTWLSANLPYSI